MPIGDVLRGMAHKIDPDPQRVLVSLTEEGKRQSEHMRGGGRMGLIMTYLEQYAPQTIAQIAINTDIPSAIVKRIVDENPTWFVKR